MENTTGFNALMDLVCARWGFCGCIKNGRSFQLDHIIPTSGPVTVDQFVEWVFLADDMNPNSDLEKWAKLKKKIYEAFIECMGSDVVDARDLRYKI